MKENNMKHKYLILDFGKVIVYPTTGDWDITPKFLELIDISKLDIDKFNEVRKNYNYLLFEILFIILIYIFNINILLISCFIKLFSLYSIIYYLLFYFIIY